MLARSWHTTLPSKLLLENLDAHFSDKLLVMPVAMKA